MTARLPENLDLIATAPAGIQKLRGLILELAVRGKLLPQDPNDEPASELLKRIAKERARFGSTKRKASPIPLRHEWPFELPGGWEWSLFGEIAEIERGGSPRPIKSYLTDDPHGLNWIKIGDTDKGGKYITAAEDKIRRSGLSKTRMVYPGDFLLTNSMSFGRPYITQIEGCIHDGWLRIGPPGDLDKDYLYSLLSSPFVRKLFVEAAAGAVVMNLNADKVRELPIPLPPLAEQHRIVAKVDELMALCDRLEAEQADAGAAHARLVATLLGTLTQSADAAELAANWQRLAEHFDTLFTTEASLDALKQTILQLAVMGKLVPQDPNDEPASELLKRIATERARLEAEGICKRSKPLPPVGDDEWPFDLPAGWEWVRLGTLLSKLGAGSTPLGGKQVYVNEGVKFLRSQNVWNDGLRLDDVALILPEVHLKMSGTHVEAGDLLFNITGASIGRCAAVPQSFDTGNVSQHVTIIRLVSPDTRQFLHSVLTSNLVQQTVMDVQVGVSREGLSIGKLAQFVIPLPPLAEQHRIVAKVDELLALCDRLKAGLAESRARQERLAATLIESALQAA